MSTKNNGKYVSIGTLQYRGDLDDKKQPARTYAPGDVIKEDLEDAQVERLLARGRIREVKQAKAEEKARAEAAAAAQNAQDAADEAQRVAEAAAAAEAEGTQAEQAGGKRGKR